MTTEQHLIRADAKGFLIADSATDIGQLVAAMEGVREDTSDILALLKSSARENLLRMQKVATPASQAAAGRRATARAADAPARATLTVNPLALVASPPPARERDHLGRFAPSMPAQAPAVSAAPVPAAHQSVRDSRAPTPVAAPVAPAAPAPRNPAAPPAVPGVPTPRGPAAAPASPARARDDRGRFIAGPVPDLSPVARAVESLKRQPADLAKADKRAESSRENLAPSEGAARVRDARGRFGSGGGAAGGEREGAGLLSRLKSLIPQFSGGTSDLERVDPTVEAAKEAGQMMATPFKAVGAVAKVGGRGFNLSAEKAPAVPWYRRLWQELRLSRRQDSDFYLAQMRTLKEIERKTGMGGNDGAKAGLIGGLAGLLGGMLGGRGGLLGGVLGRGGGALGRGGGLLRGALGLGKGLMRRIPLLGALFPGGSALASVFGGGNPMKSAAENRKDRFTGAGSGIGALVGVGLGMLVGGPLGAIVGGVIGDKVGELIGGWLSEVDWGKVGAQMTQAWDSSVQWFRDKWTVATGKWDAFVAGAGQAWDNLVEGTKAFLKDKFGIDVDAITAKAKAALAPVADMAKAGYEKAKDGAKAAVDYGKERVEKMAAPIARAATKTYEAAVVTGNGALEKIIPGYRHKASFAGIKGGEALGKYGSYTNAEAGRIKELKTRGANTSANLQGGMPKAIQEKIIAQAKAEDLDPAMMLKIAAMESGGNANAISSTGAIGVYQFTGQTASGVGIKDRFNADQNIAGGMKLTQANMASLQKSGLPVTAENLYMMHQLGPGAAKEVIAGARTGKNIADLSADTQKAMALNYGAGSKTAAEYLSKNGAALTSRADAVIGKSATGYLPTAVAAAPGKAGASGAPGAAGAGGTATAAATAAPGEPGDPGAAGIGRAIAASGAAGAAGGAGAARVNGVATAIAAAPGKPGASGAPGAPRAPAMPGAPGAPGRAAAFATAAPASFQVAGAPVMQAPAPAVMPPVAASSAPTAPPRMSTPSVAVPAAASVPPVAQASIPVPLSSKAPMEVTIADDRPVSQDLRDRRLAMIATGGLVG